MFTLMMVSLVMLRKMDEDLGAIMMIVAMLVDLVIFAMIGTAWE